MRVKLPDWLSSFFWPAPAVDVPNLAQQVAAEYVVEDGKIYFKLHFPEEGSAQEIKRAVLKHVEYCGMVDGWGTYSSGLWPFLMPRYNPGDTATISGVVYEVIQTQDTTGGVPGNGN